MTPEEKRAYNREWQYRRYTKDPLFREWKRTKNRERRQRMKNDPEYCERQRAYNREWQNRRYAENPVFREWKRTYNHECHERKRTETVGRLDTMLEDYFAYLKAEVADREAA